MEDIKLPKHSEDGELMKAFQNRRSYRKFDPSKSLTDQQLSDLLWVAYGENREKKQGDFGGFTPCKTVPSACAMYPLKLFVFTKERISEYIPESHQLKFIKAGNFMEKTGSQDFVKDASANIVVFWNHKIYESAKTYKQFLKGIVGIKMASMDCGLISENIYLYCTKEGLKTIMRADIGDEKYLRELVNLDENYEGMFAQSVGY